MSNIEKLFLKYGIRRKETPIKVIKRTENYTTFQKPDMSIVVLDRKLKKLYTFEQFNLLCTNKLESLQK